MNSEKEIIYIGQPYIKTEDEKAKLCADITEGETVRTLYYEVDKKYAEFLCDDRADAFVVGLIHSAMFDNKNIVSEVGITEQLLFQLKMYYIPVLARNMSDMNEISIECNTLPSLETCANAVGTGNSGGVDSFYTMLKYNDPALKSYKLTHVIFNNISTADDDDDRIRELFERDIPERRSAAEELNLEFISMYTNLYSFYKHPGIFNHYFALQYGSAPYALGKLFSVFYFSSTWPVEGFSMDESFIVSSARFDLFSLDCISNSTLKFYSAGTEVDRMAKMEYIIPNNLSKHHLQVCAIEQSFGGYKRNTKLNCGHCHKCSRTIAILYSWGMLEDYREIIDLSQFESNKAKFLGRGLASDQKAFSNQVYKILKKSGNLPKGTKLWNLLYRIRYRLAKNNKLVKLYHSIKSKGLI